MCGQCSRAMAMIFDERIKTTGTPVNSPHVAASHLRAPSRRQQRSNEAAMTVCVNVGYAGCYRWHVMDVNGLLDH